MNINSTLLFLNENYHINNYETFSSKLNGYPVKFLNFIDRSLQNEKIVVPLVITYTIGMTEIFYKLSNYAVNYLFDNHYLQILNTDNKEDNANYLVLTVVYLSLTLLNLGAYKFFKPGLSPVIYTALTTITVTATLLNRRLVEANEQ